MNTDDQKRDEKKFIDYADHALQIMKQKALDMNVEGVGVMCYIPGKETKSWISKMKAVKDIGNDEQNYIAIANSKAGEMAETLINSGSKIREPKLGEFGFMGGVIEKIGSGYLLATFSGATGEQDVEISTEGINWLVSKFN